MPVPNIFANVTTSIPLSQLDQNFATAVVLGNTSVYLGNTTTTLGNVTLANANVTTALTIAGASGTAGQVLTSGGANTAPTWTTVSASQWTTSGSNIYYNSGNVSVGTSSSLGRFGVQTSGNAQWVLDGTGSNPVLFGASGGSAENTIYEAYSHQFKTGSGAINTGTERMRIANNGQFFVGTTSAISSGFMCVQSPSASYNGLTVEVPNVGVYPLICSNTSGTGDNPFVAFQSDSSHTLRGQIYYNRTGGITVYATSSDQRLKENIVNSGSGLEKLANIKIRAFDWKENGIHTDFGVIAQELYEVAPESVGVGTDKEDGSIDRPWNVGTAVLVPAMIKAIQELKALNDTQAETINALTARIVALEAR